jgi:pyruvate dehydrogenase E2 component (dihydrolipoamide acetyltransferase)
MATDVVMPQMGESIAEGTIVRWIKKVGDKVDRDEPLFEISTDKVDAEIPSPAAGVVVEIRVNEGETVPVNSVVAVIGMAGEAVSATPAAVKAPAVPAEPAAEAKATPGPAAKAAPPTVSTPPAAESVEAAPQTTEDLLRHRSSPLVRKIAKENNVDISHLHGSGIAGRVTKQDILGYLGREGQEGRDGQQGRDLQVGRAGHTAAPPAGAASAPQAGPAAQIDPASHRVEKMSPMRKRIAEHMIASRRTSAHVHSVFEVNFSRVAQARDAHKSDFERAGVKLTYLSFIVKASIDALRAVPVVNASVDGDSVVYHKDVNIGVAVALDWGLIVPVIRQADEKNLLGLSRSIADLAGRARSKQLKPEEVQGGTFTITNPGVFGALFGMPIISQPQLAILGVGNIEKRPVVIDDAIAIRPMAYLTLGYDHRVIDGAVADEFMSHVKRTLENWDPKAV